jgi:hypothetical protein
MYVWCLFADTFTDIIPVAPAASLLLQLLEKVTNSQVQQERADRTKELEQQRALDMLPGTFDVLRAVFGDKGPCVKPKSEVGPRECRVWLY